MSCVWAEIKKPEPVNFKDIISEQIACELKEKKDFASNENTKNEVLTELPLKNIEDDKRLAKLMQIQLDQEVNKNISEESESEDDAEEDINITIRGDWEKFDCIETHVIPHSKYKTQDETVEQPVEVFKRKMAFELLLEFPEYEVMRKHKLIDMNTIFDTTEKAKVEWYNLMEHKVFSEFVGTLDDYTITLINHLFSKKLLKKIDGVLSINSSEAIVFHAESNPQYSGANENFPKKLVIKVFKKVILTYKQPWNNYYYIWHSDWKQPSVKNFTRWTLNQFARKEISNLKTLQDAGVRCPQPIMVQKHMVIMSFIGENKKPAPKLKDVKLTHNECISAYEEVKEAMKIMYQKVNLIHTDFMENNILWFQNHCYFIDFSQAKEPTEKGAYDDLMNDCKTVTDFFKKRNVPNMLTPAELFQYVTQFDYNNKLLLSQKQTGMEK